MLVANLSTGRLLTSRCIRLLVLGKSHLVHELRVWLYLRLLYRHMHLRSFKFFWHDRSSVLKLIELFSCQGSSELRLAWRLWDTNHLRHIIYTLTLAIVLNAFRATLEGCLWIYESTTIDFLILRLIIAGMWVDVVRLQVLAIQEAP